MYTRTYFTQTTLFVASLPAALAIYLSLSKPQTWGCSDLIDGANWISARGFSSSLFNVAICCTWPELIKRRGSAPSGQTRRCHRM